MNLKTLNTGLLATSAVALLALGASNSSFAIDQTMDATFATAAGLEVADGTDLDLGTWVVAYKDGPDEEITITIPPTLGGGAPGVPTPGVADEGTVSSGQDSVVSNTIAPASSGTFTVTSAVAGPLQISGDVTTDFTAPNLSLGALMYDTDNEGPAAVPDTPGTPVVTVASGGSPEEVAIGATLTISGTVAADTTFDPAVITITLNY